MNSTKNQPMKLVLIISSILLFFSFNARAQNELLINKTLKRPTHFKAVINANNYTDTLITIRLTKSKLNYLKENQIDLSSTASELLANYSVAKSDTTPLKIVNRKILEDGGFETTYEDGSRRIKYKGGSTFITPEGDEFKSLFVQVPTFVPPSDPNDPDIAQYLDNIHNELSNFLSELLDNDAESISNFENGDTGLSIYQKINRRFEIINYLISH